MRPRVSLTQGVVEGTHDQGAHHFLRLPYAAPPVGDLRWRPPSPPQSWEGVYDASYFGPACPQTRGAIFDLRVSEQSEDCLHLNIWTRTLDRGARQPVMVWIHGGGFVGGAGSEDGLDGTSLSGQGVTVVTLNYRLGAFGYAAHPDIGANFAVLDQIAALKWVAENIEAFGGDPDNVTVFGQSAGAASVRALLSAYRAKGLFHRAILQSAGFEPAASQPKPPGPERTLAATRELFAKLGGDVEAARNASTDEVLALSEALAGIRPPAGQVHTPANLVWTPISDDREVAEGDNFVGWPAEVPVMLGVVDNEARYFLPPNAPVAPEVLENMAKALAGRYAEEVLDLFAASGATTYEALDQLFTTAVFTEPALATLKRFAALNRVVYYYHFGRVSPGFLKSGHLAKHTAEIRYLFGNLSPDEEYDDTDAALSRDVQSAWVSFARTGKPSLPDGSVWPRYGADASGMTIIGDTLQAAPFVGKELTGIIHRLRS
ncbi:carboxylesterase/lipase family protein [Streptomyces sp. NPDC056405]|uniref:carboxylesterase/lipase family protein n=1 Tax=Streptomyces sp. NPDC056405 TaxID=3345811 RepID=UPI0035DD0B2C